MDSLRKGLVQLEYEAANSKYKERIRIGEIAQFE